MLVAIFHPIVAKDIAALIVAGAILTTAVKLAAVSALSRHVENPVLQSVGNAMVRGVTLE
jgi:hypothetical protein